MKRILLALTLFPIVSFGQIVPAAATIDSTVYNFAIGDSMHHTIRNFFGGPVDTAVMMDTTTAAGLWQIGQTTKPGFTGGTGTIRGIMTDTTGNYPPNANAWFAIDIPHLPNVIVTLWHRYQMDSLHAGALIEYSQDSGASWMNAGTCPFMTYNMYTSTDTILGGQAAFTGTSNGTLMTQLQFTNCVGVRTTSTQCYPDFSYWGHIWLRFRFLSDSSSAAMAGWIIDSIKVGEYGCPGSVRNNMPEVFSMSPNPTSSTLSISSPETINDIEILNMTGQLIFHKSGINSYTLDQDLSHLPEGFYMLRVNRMMMGKFLKY